MVNMDKPVRVRLRVEESVTLRLDGSSAFTRALSEWGELPWIKFLKEHGEIVQVEQYKEYETCSTIYTVHWQLPNELKSWFYLTYADEIQG